MNLKDFFRRKAPSVDGMEQAPSSVIDTSTLPIGREQIAEAYHLLNKYKSGKANLENKIIDNQKWYRARHWDEVGSADDEIKHASAWLFNILSNKHASYMDNFPSCNVLPRELTDQGEAEALSAVIPVVLDGCNFEKTYDEVNNYKGITGTGCYAVYWDNDLHNGLGDINVKMVDLLTLFWEPGITDIQKSRNVFHVELCDNDLLKERYPELEGKLGGGAFNIAEYRYDDTVDTSNKSAVIDWYYKKKSGTKDVLHYCKFVGNTVLFATENEPEYAEVGWYDDGKYPFVFDVLFPVPGSPAGFGFVDIGKDTQKYIDLMGASILENALWSASPRYFVPTAGDVNEAEFLDRKRSLVHYAGQGDGIVPVRTNPLPGICYEVYQGKIDELKETTGTRDVNTGGASGVTAASAIAALQEAGSKLDRDDIKAAYRAFKEIVIMVIERIRQFYDEARWFRILGPDGGYKFIQYSNERLKMEPNRFDENGKPISFKMPFFDVEVVPQKASAYSKLSQNELALEFYRLGMFDPSRSDMAIAALEMMDFDRKSFVVKKVSENGTMMDMIMMLQQQMVGMQAELDRVRGTQLAPQMAASMQGGGAPSAPVGGEAHLSEEAKESSVTANARKRVAESTSPV